MSETLKLNVTEREAAGKDLNRSRKAGLVPAVLYGHSVEPRMFWVNAIEFGKVTPRRISGNCALHQRKVTLAIKRARNIALLPFTVSD